METRICSECKVEKPLLDFSKNKDGLLGFRTVCKECNKKYQRDYYMTNKVSMNIRGREYHKKNKKAIKELQSRAYKEIRNKFIEMYGKQCACCGEAIKEFLTIEHKLGQVGKKKETSRKSYSNALKEYRPDLYEILCYNCNCAKGKLGYCPHKKLEDMKNG